MNNAGLMAPTAKAIGVDRRTIYRWIDADDDLKEAVRDAKESVLDMAESKLMQNIKSGDNASIFFYLKCQAKHRGYVERKEHEQIGDQTIKIIKEVIGGNK